MNTEKTKDILFALYLLLVSLLALIYFSVPERRLFIENQLEWWGELRKIIESLL